MKRNTFLKIAGILPFLKIDTKPIPSTPKEEVTFFTPEMLNRHNYGLFIIDSKVKKITHKNIGYASTMCYKLGWHITRHEIPPSGRDKELLLRYNRYCMMNVFTDGCTFPIGDNYEEVCNYLNNNRYGEKFRLMTKEEVIFILSNRKQGFL